MRRFRLDPSHPIPIMLQLQAQISHQIRLGLIRPGDQLPSVRALAARLGLNRNTVARVMADLEAAGYVVAQQGRGVFAADDLPLQERGAELRWAVGEALDSAARLGLSSEAFALSLFAHGQMGDAGAVLPQQRVLVVSGERTALRSVKRAVEAILPVLAEPVLSDLLPERWAEALRAREHPPVLVTPAHLPEVDRTVAGTAPVIPLVQAGEQQAWTDLWARPAGTRVAVVATDWLHAARLRVAVAAAAPQLHLYMAAGFRAEHLAPALAHAPHVVCAGSAAPAVREALANAGTQLLADTAVVDDEITRAIRQALDAPRPAGQRDPHGVSPWF